MSVPSQTSSRDFEPDSQGWGNFTWSGGSFDTAFRPPTRQVEGRISLPHPTIMTIVQGGCSAIEVVSDCGHVFRGADFAGSVSYFPPGCGRYIKMKDVRSEWASLSIRPDFFQLGEDRDTVSSPPGVRTFTNQRDPFLHVMLAELRRLYTSGEQLDGLYCEAMALSAAQYLMRRYSDAEDKWRASGHALTGWRLRRVKDHMAAHLGDPSLRLDDVARSVGLSTGFFHRAFKEAMGQTPLAYIQRLRIERAMQLLSSRDLTVLEVAMEVGFLSPSHFSRLFQRQVGVTPSQYRKGLH